MKTTCKASSARAFLLLAGSGLILLSACSTGGGSCAEQATAAGQAACQERVAAFVADPHPNQPLRTR